MDGGEWTDAATPDQPTVEFDLTLPIEIPFDTIQWRAIDAQIGITSPMIQGTSLVPALASASVSGLAFDDTDGNGQRNGNEIVLANTTVKIQHLDGAPWLAGAVDARDYPDGILPVSLTGSTIQVSGESLHTNVGSFVSSDAGDQRVFYSFDTSVNRWSEKWSGDDVFGVTFDLPVGQVSLDVVGIRDQSFGRLEGFDAAGNLVARVTTNSLADGSSETLTLRDPENRIATIRAHGHAGTIVALQRLTFGIEDTYITGESGAWSFRNVADGQYTVELIPERVTHQFDNPVFNIEVSGGSSEMMMATARRVDSIRHNSAQPEDATGFDGVTARDALVIINDLARNSPRILQPQETDGFDVDVNNDGMVSALDALLVINFLGRANSGSEQSAGGNNSAVGIQPRMLNSAGSDVPIESAGVSGADRDDRGTIDVDAGQPKIETPVRAKFTTIPTQNPRNRDEKLAIENDVQEPIDPFTADFKEPFSGYAV